MKVCPYCNEELLSKVVGHTERVFCFPCGILWEKDNRYIWKNRPDGWHGEWRPLPEGVLIVKKEECQPQKRGKQ